MLNHIELWFLFSDPDATPSTASGVTPVLNSDLFKAHIIPELQRIFNVHDAHIRLVLLQHFSSYVHLFEEDVLQNEIFPQVLVMLLPVSSYVHLFEEDVLQKGIFPQVPVTCLQIYLAF